MRKSLIPVILVLMGLITVLLTACPKRIETSEPGRGGLPSGIVEEGNAPLGDENYPLYPGSVLKAKGIYETTDRIEIVRDYYIDLLRMQPETRDDYGEVFTFVTAEYTLVLLPRLAPESGTEIGFEVLAAEDD